MDNALTNVGNMPKTFADTSLNEICKDCLKNYGFPCCNDSDNECGSECGMLETANEEYKVWLDAPASERKI